MYGAGLVGLSFGVLGACFEKRPGDQLEGGAVSRARATVYGFITIFGIPLLGLLWLISVTPPWFWVLFVVCIVLAFCILSPEVGFSRDPEEAKRRARVRSLQHDVSRLRSEVDTTRRAIGEAGYSGHGGSRIHEIPPLQRKLAEQEQKLAKARQELNTIWKQTDGSTAGGWPGEV